MNSEEIYKFLWRMLKGQKCYFNVLPCDGLNTFQPSIYPFYLVINNQKGGEPGEHWTALFRKNKDTNLEFFVLMEWGYKHIQLILKILQRNWVPP